MQHFATLFYATFLKKYGIKNCKLEKVAKKFFSFGFLKKLKLNRRYRQRCRFFIAEGVMACKGKKRK